MPASAPRLRRQLFSLTTPIFSEMPLIMLLGAMDIIILSQYSDNTMAAVGMDTRLMAFNIFEVFTAGTMVLCARYRGAREKPDMTRVIGIPLLLGITLGWGLAGMGVAFVPGENIRALLLGHRRRGRQWALKFGGRAS